MDAIRNLFAALGGPGALWNAADAVESLLAQERAVDELAARLRDDTLLTAA